MRTILKILIFIPLILFLDYILLATLGGIASVCGARDSFYCGAYCYIAIALFSVSALVVTGLCFRNPSDKNQASKA